MLHVRVDQAVADRVDTMGARDRDVVRENILSIATQPQRAGCPSFNSRAKQGAWQHVCPHSFVLLYRWGADAAHPPDAVTIEDIVDRF
jgi:hypothetical protein